MSTRPALPSSESDAFSSDKTGSVIDQFLGWPFLRYGATSKLRNLSIALLFSAGAATAEPVTIAAFGDSLTAGYGLTADNGFVPQLQSWLENEGADVSVINAGVSGDTTAGGLSRIGWTLTPEVDAMIVALGANDYLRALDPNIAKVNLAGILEEAESAGVEVLLVGMEVGSNYGPDYKAAFDQIFPSLSVEFDVALFPDWFTGMRQVSEDQASFFRLMQNDGLHPNAEGVGLIVAAMGPAVLELVAQAKD